MGTLLLPPILAASGKLTVSSIRLAGLQLLDESAVRAASGVSLGDALLSGDPRVVEERLMAIPFVAWARVRVGLPGEIRIEIREEDPLLRWSIGGATYLVSGAGKLLDLTTSPLISGSARTLLELLPLVSDLRHEDLPLPGATLSALDLDIATRLAGITLADLGSRATHLTIVRDPEYGFLLCGEGEGISWNAVFGIYSVTIRPPEMLPGQVRLLRSLLADREDRVGWVILADGQTGTFTKPGVRPPPPPGASPEQTASPSPSLVLP
jgi:hypothetical protein